MQSVFAFNSAAVNEATMNKFLAICGLTAACTCLQATPTDSLADGQVGRIEFNSSNPPNRWAMIRGSLGKLQLVFGDLLLPKIAAAKRVPAVVFSHGS